MTGIKSKSSRKGAKAQRLLGAIAPLRELCSALAIGLLVSMPLRAQSDAKVPDPDPELERRALQVADGFEVNLFAADPLLAKPIQMNFDPAGRLWVACSEVYPHIKPGEKANDKIIILEDRDGDGRADKTTVFADGLLIPTGVAPGDGGAYVANSTELLHLADADGDGRADRRRILLSGFGTEDTHHILHTFRWGPDGQLYFNQSVYIHSHVETPYGVRRLNAGGVWQYRPEAQRLEVFLRGFWNPWGHHFDRWGKSFVTDGAYVEGIIYGVPGASYPGGQGVNRLLRGLNPGSPKHCGLEVLSGRHLPEDWRGNVLTNDFRGHRVCRFVLRADGSGYTSQEKAELIKTNHPAFRPIDIKMGPDGAIYVADWYNPIIQHGEVDFRDPRRDHTRGRIWRVTAKGRPLVPRPRLVDAPTQALLDAFKAPEDWTRHQAKRVLKERGKKIIPDLEQWISRLDPDDADVEHHLLEALWTYQSLDVTEPKLLGRLLNAKDHHARAAATRVAAAWHARLSDPLGLLAARVADDHPQVRLEAVCALAHLNTAQAAEVALRALDRPMDANLDYALWLTVRDLEPAWMPALQKGALRFGDKPRYLLFALQAAGSPTAVGQLVELVRAGKATAENEEEVWNLIAALGGPQELDMVFRRVLDDRAAGPRRVKLLAALEQAARQRQARPAGDLNRLKSLLTATDEPLCRTAIQLAGLWKVESLRGPLVQYARAAAGSDAIRAAAMDSLARLGGSDSRKELDTLAGPEQSAKVRRQAISALAALDQAGAARRAADLLAALKDGDDPAELLAAFVNRRGGAAALAKALADRQVPADVARLGVRALGSAGRDAAGLIQALTKAGNLSAARRVLTAQEVQELAADVLKHGDPARGEAVFRRKDLVCLKCHAIAGAGGQAGPDLVSIGASAPVDYLVDSILQPNKAIKENYHSLVVTTTDGRIFTGVKVRETKTELILRDGEDREVAVALKDVERTTVGGSLMPEGLADQLTRAELVDLVRFLSELGKVGPYSVSKARLVRRWQVLEPTREAYHLLMSTRIAAAATDDPKLTWSPAYSQVSGTLPPDGLPRFTFQHPPATLSFIRCQLDVTRGGKVKMLLNSPAGLTLWLDGTPVEAKGQAVLDVTPGLHALTFALDCGRRHEPLRCELDEAPQSPALARIVSGK
jgi:putative heme-binding domain-containing protein